MKILNEKKGFTLIELLAVIVILAVIMLAAGQSVFGIIGNAQKGSFNNEFIGLLQAAQASAQVDMATNKLRGNTATVCYSLEWLYEQGYFTGKNKNDAYHGSVLVKYDPTSVNSIKLYGWMTSDSYATKIADAEYTALTAITDAMWTGTENTLKSTSDTIVTADTTKVTRYDTCNGLMSKTSRKCQSGSNATCS